ncbi:hypothetical protein CF327_g7115 [Tilletia walkeri]|uniref:LCCL domain-containing protein n=1 Tax=Tilletia walkeri TaxID=117179 RepID=A0A8X7T225_9BASI|nr:hypothetical protein CF327_g7115 [Tilletia walkeri]KAE8266067.1 hypothetical protein A4X09_0g6281 [Tilletia walkeri]
MSAREGTFQTESIGSSHLAPTGRRRRPHLSVPTLKAVGLWLQGPSTPEQLTIRHYPWWPFGGVERAWIKITSPVAWKDPIEASRQDAENNADAGGPGTFEGLRERGRAKARSGIRHVREGLPTWARPSDTRRESNIEMSPSPVRRRQQDGESSAFGSADTAVEPLSEEGLRQRNHQNDLEPTTSAALRSNGGRGTNTSTGPPHHSARGDYRAGKETGSTEIFSNGSDKATDTVDVLLPTTATLARQHPATSHDGQSIQTRADEDGYTTQPDDFIESVKRDWRLNRLHWLLLFLTCACWIIAFGVLAKSLWYESTVSSADGSNESPASFYGCTATYWLRNSGCGLDGQNCAPFTSGSPTAFRCPQGCLGTKLGAPRAVGDLRPAWVPLIVGGGDSNQTYRGDSWVCAAAAHAGVIDDTRGGCATLTLTGTFSQFIGVSRNGVDSVDFNSTFPVSYRFGTDISSGKCTDRRGQLYVLDVIMSAFVGLVLRPKPIVWFWILVCVGYWHVNFASEPRDFPPPVGAAFGDFLPTLFGCYAIWRLAFRFVWPSFQHLPLEREIWTLAAFWIGVLLNVVFANVPLNRLVASDIASQPGSLTALIILIIIVVVLVINQIRVIRKTTFLPRYLSIYIIGGIIVGLLAAIPGQSLRLHHYIIALVLLPGCAFPTRLGLIYCAFLLGMFENGLARWGWDGLIQDVAVVIGDGVMGTGRPVFLNSSTNWAGLNSSSPTANGLVAWAPLNNSDLSQSGFDSFNLLVDDVLRYSGSGTTFNLSSLEADYSDISQSDNSSASPSVSLTDTLRDEPHYLRLAFASGSGSIPGDFTRAAIAYYNGTFVDAPAGAT